MRKSIIVHSIIFTFFTLASLVSGTAHADEFIVEAQPTLIINQFSEWLVTNGHEHKPEGLPSLRVLNEPNLIFIEFDENRVTVPDWKGIPSEMQNFFHMIAKDNDGEKLFIDSFNAFFVAHEMAHWLQNRIGFFSSNSFYVNEQHANRLSVEFLSSHENGRALLKRMRNQCDTVLSVLTDPTPADQTPEKYFSENYQMLGQDPSKYGYYQFYFVKKAIDEESQHTYESLVLSQ